MSDALIIGWREWVKVPGLKIDWVKAKIDTGARTSAIHAFYTERFVRDGDPWVRFGVHPRQGDTDYEVHCEAPIHDERVVTDSGGHREMRPVILTDVVLGEAVRTVEMTLTDRDSMLFRMLIGRTAMRDKTLVEPARSFLLGGDKTAPPEIGN
jgi:hypothetical protein